MVNIAKKISVSRSSLLPLSARNRVNHMVRANGFSSLRRYYFTTWLLVYIRVKIELIKNHVKMENVLKFKNFSFFKDFSFFFQSLSTNSIFTSFFHNTNNQVIKNYVIGQVNPLAQTMWAYARLRASWAAVKMSEKMRFFAIFIIALYGGAVSARATTRAQMVRADGFSWPRIYFVTTWLLV